MPDYLPGAELEALEALLKQCLNCHKAQEGDEEQFILNVLEVLGKVYPNACQELFQSIAHGNEEHQIWLKNEMSRWFRGGL